jgi:hypothetical protein
MLELIDPTGVADLGCATTVPRLEEWLRATESGPKGGDAG